jgi:hypothetical protein
MIKEIKDYCLKVRSKRQVIYILIEVVWYGNEIITFICSGLDDLFNDLSIFVNDYML